MSDRYLALLRGINVGGHRITGPELVDVFARLGLTEGATFLASGNVIFTGENVDGPTIEESLADALGYAVPVFLRRGDQVRALADRDPFPADVGAASTGKLQMMALNRPPTDEVRSTVLALASDDDQLEIDDTEIWWLPSGNLLDSELDLAAIERLAGPTTMRTKNTINRIAKKFFAAH
jgi:uncharacterized protein (DUF1697 family)